MPPDVPNRVMVLSEVPIVSDGPHDGVGGGMSPGPQRGREDASTATARSSDHRPGGTHRPLVRADSLIRRRTQAAAMVASWRQRNELPSFQIRKRLTASLRATATAAFRSPLRAASLTPQLLSDEKRLTLDNRAHAASYRQARSMGSPDLEIRPE